MAKRRQQHPFPAYYIGPNSRTERPGKTKIGTEVVHVTRDSDTTFKVKMSKVKITRPLCSPPCWRVRRLQRWACMGTCRPWETAATLPSARRRKALRRPRGEERGGAYRGGRPPAHSLFKIIYMRPASALSSAFWPPIASLLLSLPHERKKKHTRSVCRLKAD